MLQRPASALAASAVPAAPGVAVGEDRHLQVLERIATALEALASGPGRGVAAARQPENQAGLQGKLNSGKGKEYVLSKIS